MVKPNKVTSTQNEPRKRRRFASPWITLLEFYMERSGVNQPDLADKMGVGKGMVNHYATGRNLPPVAEKLEQVVDALGLTEAEAIGFREEAHLANSPPEIRQLVTNLRAELRAARGRTRSS